MAVARDLVDRAVSSIRDRELRDLQVREPQSSRECIPAGTALGADAVADPQRGRRPPAFQPGVIAAHGDHRRPPRARRRNDEDRRIIAGGIETICAPGDRAAVGSPRDVERLDRPVVGQGQRTSIRRAVPQPAACGVPGVRPEQDLVGARSGQDAEADIGVLAGRAEINRRHRCRRADPAVGRRHEPLGVEHDRSS